jgi:hypothetical protein
MSKTVKRRELLKNAMIFGAGGLLSPAPRLYGAIEGGHSGRLLVQMQVEGGWDVSSYCDPKENIPGELEITSWSRDAETLQAGNIPFAPFANNEWFFNKYHKDMMVINGVDAQTNSHTVGIIHNWSGRNSVGYPTLSAMFAANNAPEQPLSYINFGGFSQTGGLIRFTRLDDVNSLRELLIPNQVFWQPDETWRRQSDIDRVASYRQRRIEQLKSEVATPRMRDNLDAYEAALTNRSSLSEFDRYIPTENELIQPFEIPQLTWSNLGRQIQLAVAAFDSGLASAADLYLGGFDTHQNHDAGHLQLFNHLNEMIDFFWTEAELRGLADRITMVIASDFSRTPWYNADNGKDHWPIGSVIVMEKNASWGDRVLGVTDGGQNAVKVNPQTLKEDQGGSIIYPKHVHKALRRYLGLEDTPQDQQFKFLATEDFNFFN